MGDECPLNTYGHKYFVFKTFEAYDLYSTTQGLPLYAKQEYAVLGCNCGNVIKQKIVDKGKLGEPLSDAV